MKQMEDPKCNYCLKKFNDYYILCAECKNVKLCPACVAHGVEGGSHKPYHAYFVRTICDPEKFPVFVGNREWTHAEEVALLQAVEIYSIGNWQDVAQKVETKTAEECCKHFFKFYIHGRVGRNFIPARRPCSVQDHTTSEGAPLSPSLYAVLPPADLTPEEQQLLGFMPKRDDFERDYDNDAESLLCRLQPPSGHEDELINSLKVAQVEIYTHRLKERLRRKRIAREHNLIPYIMADILNKKTPTGAAANGSASAARRNGASCRNGYATTHNGRASASNAAKHDAFHIDDRLKPTLRYFTAIDGKEFLNNLEREDILRKEIKELCEIRRKGKTKLAGIKLKVHRSTSVYLNGCNVASEPGAAAAAAFSPSAANGVGTRAASAQLAAAAAAAKSSRRRTKRFRFSYRRAPIRNHATVKKVPS